MSDLKERQEEFRIKIIGDNFGYPTENRYKYLYSQSMNFGEGFDAFRLSPEYLAMKEALKFYGNVDNYDTHPAWGEVCILEKDTEKSDRFPFLNINCGGKKAREVLSQLVEYSGEFNGNDDDNT